MKQVSVADLIAYRQRKETLVQRLACSDVETPGGKAQVFTYSVPWDVMHHVAVVFGDIRDGEDVPVRLHSEDVVNDVFGTHPTLKDLLASFGERQRGVVIYLREGSVGVAHSGRNRPVSEERETHDEARRREAEWREIGLGCANPQGSRRTVDRPHGFARAPLCRSRRASASESPRRSII